MALIGNRSVLHKSPGRFLSGTVASIERSNFGKAGMLRFADFGAAIPSGHLSPSAWKLPRTAGGMSSRNEATAAVAVAGLAVGGVTTTGATTITFLVAAAEGSLISAGSGSAAFSLSASPLLLTASIGGAGSATFSVAVGSPILGAEASLVGSAGLAFSGALTPYAIGQMSGSTVDTSVLTVDTIAAGILAAAAATPISADIRKVNSYAVDGTGQPGAEWGPV